jgi:hypothetical protein
MAIVRVSTASDLITLARRLRGDKRVTAETTAFAKTIEAANPGIDTDKLAVGSLLVIPQVEGGSTVAGVESEAVGTLTALLKQASVDLAAAQARDRASAAVQTTQFSSAARTRVLRTAVAADEGFAAAIQQVSDTNKAAKKTGPATAAQWTAATDGWLKQVDRLKGL